MDRRRYRETRIQATANFEELSELISPLPSPERLAITGQITASVTRALAAVPSEQREALELSFFAGLSHAEIADRLGEPLGTVKTRIRLAVGRLRELVRDSV